VPTVEEALAVLAGTIPPRVFAEAWLDTFDADHASPYWVARYGIGIAADNRCGTDPSTGAPTYPIRDAEGRLWGVVSRHQDEKPKYRYPWNTSTSRTLYGALRPAPVVVLVEGASDVMACQQSRIPDGWCVAGCFGAGVHFPQVALIATLAPKVVIAAFGDDEAGQRANQAATAQLEELVPVVSHPWGSVGPGITDAGEAPIRRRIASMRELLVETGHGRYV
jgi:Toprim-like